MDDLFGEEFGLPHPEWERVHAWMGDGVDDPARWGPFLDEWLGRLRDGLGDRYVARRAHCVLSVEPAPVSGVPSVAQRSAEVLSLLERRFAALLDPGDAGSEWPLVVLAFADTERFLDYISSYSPDGESAMPAGVCIDFGYPHVALNAQGGFQLDTLVHEIAHIAIGSDGRPRWVEEGLVEYATVSASGARDPWITREQINELRAFWSERGMTGFWSGKDFLDPESVSESYELALIFGWQLALKEERYLAFVKDAKLDDAGEASARQHLGCGLGGLAARLFGAGRWGPGEA